MFIFMSFQELLRPSRLFIVLWLVSHQLQHVILAGFMAMLSKTSIKIRECVVDLDIDPNDGSMLGFDEHKEFTLS